MKKISGYKYPAYLFYKYLETALLLKGIQIKNSYFMTGRIE